LRREVAGKIGADYLGAVHDAFLLEGRNSYGVNLCRK
jgi:hypothetical protein